MIDENTALFAAGNVVELLNLETKEQTYIRSTSGGGIGALAVSTINRSRPTHVDVMKQE